MKKIQNKNNWHFVRIPGGYQPFRAKRVLFWIFLSNGENKIIFAPFKKSFRKVGEHSEVIYI